MNEYEQERSQNLQKKIQVKEIDYQQNYSNDNTPVRYSDHIIDDDKIEIDLSGEDPRNQKYINNSPEGPLETQPPVQTQQQDLETEEVMNIPTDRKLTSGGINELNELNEVNHQNGNFFPKSNESAFESKSCFGSCCFKIRKLFLMIGATLSFLNFAGDIIYASKVPFYKHWMWMAMVFLGVRYLAFFVMACQQMKNAAAKTTTNKKSYEKTTLIVVILEFFSNLAGIPILTTFGLFRLLPLRDFLREICIGYVLEITTATIPMMLIQWENNQLHREQLGWVPVFCLVFRMFAIFFLPFELLVMAWEARYNYKVRVMQQLRQARVGDDRAKKYSERVAKVTFVSMIAIICMLVCGLSLTEGRSCPGKANVLNWGVCTKCEDDHCLDCWQGPAMCNTCVTGFREDKLSGKCIQCDADSTDNVKCEKCMPKKNGGSQCIQCADGFHLDPVSGQCVDCAETTGVQNCASCHHSTCNECMKDHFFKSAGGREVCSKCSDQFENCESCSESRCNTCQSKIAKFDDRGQCTKCQTPWLHSKSQDQSCFCPFIVDVADNYSCKECHQLISGCQKCEYATRLRRHQMGRYIGWDPKLSAMNTQYTTVSNRENQPSWIICTESQDFVNLVVPESETSQENSKMDGVPAVISPSLDVQDNTEETMEEKKPQIETIPCDALIPDCAACEKSEENLICTACKSEHYLHKVWSQYNEHWGLNLINTCMECPANCQDCNSSGCSKCREDYTMKWTGSCMYCPAKLALLCT